MFLCTFIPSQLVIGFRRIILIAELFFNHQALAITLPGLAEVPLLLGNHSQLVIGAGFAFLMPFLFAMFNYSF